MSGSWAHSQDHIRPVSQRPRGDRRDKPSPTTRLAVNLSSQQDSKLESRGEIGKIGQLPVQLTIMDKNRPRLLEISTVETRHRINNQQGRSLRQENLQALRYPALLSKVFWLKHDNVLSKLSPSIQGFEPLNREGEISVNKENLEAPRRSSECRLHRQDRLPSRRLPIDQVDLSERKTPLQQPVQTARPRAQPFHSHESTSLRRSTRAQIE